MELRWQVFSLSDSKISVMWIVQCHMKSLFPGFALRCSLSFSCAERWCCGKNVGPQHSWEYKQLYRSSGSASCFKEVWFQSQLTLLEIFSVVSWHTPGMEIAQYFWATWPVLKLLIWQYIFTLYPTGIFLAMTCDCWLLHIHLNWFFFFLYLSTRSIF